MNRNSQLCWLGLLSLSLICLTCGCDGTSGAGESTAESSPPIVAQAGPTKTTTGSASEPAVDADAPASTSPVAPQESVAPPQTQAPPTKPTVGIDLQSAERELVAKHALGSDKTVDNYHAPVSHSYYVTADLITRDDAPEPIPVLQFWTRKIVKRGNRTDLHPSEYSWRVELTAPYLKDLLQFLDEFEQRKGAGYQGAPEVRAEFNWLRLSKDGHFGELVRMCWPTFDKGRPSWDEHSPWIKADVYALRLVLHSLLFRLEPDSLHGREMPLDALDGTWDGFADWGEVKFSNGSATYGLSSEYQFFKLQDDAAAEGKTQDGKMTVAAVGDGVFEGTWSDSPELHGNMSIRISEDGELALVEWKSADGSMRGSDILVRESSYTPRPKVEPLKEMSIADLDGTWDGGADWGQIALTNGLGTYSATSSDVPGQIHIKSLDVTSFRGTWSEGEKHQGTLAITMSKDRKSIRIEWSDGKRSGSSSSTKVE